MRSVTAVAVRPAFVSLPACRTTNGCFRSRTMGSVSILNSRSKSLGSSNVFITPPNIPVPGWGLQFVGGSSSVPAAGFGFSPSSEEVQRFLLQSPAGNPQEADPDQKRFSILLVEDSPA